MRFTLVAICMVLLRLVVTAQTEFELIGVVRAPDQSGIAGATVKLIGGDFRTTGNSGEFRIPISKAKTGRKITLQVYKQGWVVDDTRDLIVIVPADPMENPVRITMRPLGNNPAANSKGSAVKSSEKSVTPPDLTKKPTKSKQVIQHVENARKYLDFGLYPAAAREYMKACEALPVPARKQLATRIQKAIKDYDSGNYSGAAQTFEEALRDVKAPFSQ